MKTSRSKKRWSILLLFPALWLSPLLLADEEIPPTAIDTPAAKLFALTLTNLAAPKSPALFQGQCRADAAPVERQRLLCTASKGGAELDLLQREAKEPWIGILAPAGFSAAKRRFWECEASENLELFRCSEKFPRQKTLVSPIASTYDSVKTPLRNLHTFSAAGSKQTFFRSMVPESSADYQSLQDLKVAQVLIFRTAEGLGELKKERAFLAKHSGIKNTDVHWVPFPWKDITEPREACRLAVRGLKVLRTAEVEGKNVLVHCTVGEDRTGFLAGLWRMMNEGWSKERAWRDELCEHGFGSANPFKPALVVRQVEESLTPLFDGMSEFIQQGWLTKDRLDEAVCDRLPAKATLAKGSHKKPWPRQCVSSTLYHF